MRTHPDPSSDVLDEETCWDYIAMADIGRLAVPDLSGTIDVFPVNFTVHGHAVYFRSAPGTKMVDIIVHPDVSFEVDGQGRSRSWSVVIKGSARRLSSDVEIEESGVTQLHPRAPGDKWNYVCITPTEISGRLLHRN
jgi:nitroimidazol reductase NimA-like FMN-containing flavoprotein (pyridoxamine 5'-phosphate oxidase superfamily)